MFMRVLWPSLLLLYRLHASSGYSPDLLPRPFLGATTSLSKYWLCVAPARLCACDAADRPIWPYQTTRRRQPVLLLNRRSVGRRRGSLVLVYARLWSALSK